MNTVKSQTLEGRRIVVTRAAVQARELRERLEERGAVVMLLPLVRFLEPENTVELDGAIRSPERFDWIIFTSANAVTFFLARCHALGCRPNREAQKIAAVGSATQSALEKEGLKASLVPAKFGGAELAAELSTAIQAKSVLLPRSDRAGEELPALLRNAGANVTEVIAYRTAGPDTLDRSVVEAISSGQVDAVTFFSPSAFHEFQKLMAPDALAQWHPRVALAAVGPITAEAIRNAGWPVTIEADEATTASLVAALERHFAAGKTSPGTARPPVLNGRGA